MAISYTTHERHPLFEAGVTYGWGALFNAMLEDWDEGKHLYLEAGENIAQYDTVYIGVDGKMYKADADADATLPARGISVAAVTSGNSGRILMMGVITNDSWTFSPGAPVYASTTAGGLTQTKPTKVQKIGYARTATELVVFPDVERQREPVVDSNGDVLTHNGEVLYY